MIKSWKTDYWIAIMKEHELDGNQQANPYIYDTTGGVRNIFTEAGGDVESGANNRYNRGYVYVNTVSQMQILLDNYELIMSTQYISNFKRSMKSLEQKYLLKVIYQDRKVIFDALVAESTD